MESMRRLLFQGSVRKRDCEHLDQVEVTDPAPAVCPDCETEGTRPVKIRMCMTCGYTGCCDSSVPKHARRHFEQTGHPLMRSVEPHETWAWCYVDKAYMGAGDYLT